MPSALQAMACFPLPPAPRSHLVCTGLPAYSSCSVATPAPAADTRAGFSDLASALAKIDETDDIQKYAKLLDEFAACRQADIISEEDSPEYSESEKVAVSIYFAGILSMAQLFTLAFEDMLYRKHRRQRRNRRRTVNLRNAGNGAHRLPGKRIGIKEEDRQFANPSPAILPIPKIPKITVQTIPAL